MKYCIQCGEQLPDDARFCARCGYRQPEPAVPVSPAPSDRPEDPVPQPAPDLFYAEEPQAQGPFEEAPGAKPDPADAPQEAPFEGQPGGDIPGTPSAAPQKGRSALPFFIWSMILIFIANPLGTPLGIVGAIFASGANALKEKDPDEADGKISVAKTICIAVTCIDAVCILSLISFAVVYLLNHPGTFFWHFSTN